MIGIINIGLGNITSIQNWCNRCEIPWKIIDPKDDINEYSLILLPGVGSAGTYMEILMKSDLKKLLDAAIINGKRILGICLGAQILLEYTEEDNGVVGLGIIKGKVKKLPTLESNTGWLDFTFDKKNLSHVWKSLSQGNSKKRKLKGRVFFNHNYGMIINEEVDYNLKCQSKKYGEYFSLVHKDNLLALQFHPEKSQELGDTLLKMII